MSEILTLVPTYQAVKVENTREKRVRDINALLTGSGWVYSEANNGYKFLHDSNSNAAIHDIDSGDYVLRNSFDEISVLKGGLPDGFLPYVQTPQMPQPQPYPYPYPPQPYPGGGWYRVT